MPRNNSLTTPTKVISFAFLSICYGLFQALFSCLLCYQLFQPRLTEKYKSLANTLQPVMLILGSSVAGLLLVFGRRLFIVLIDVPIFISSCLTLFMSHPTLLFVARITHDFLRGGVMVIYLIYFKEMVPKKYAGLTIGMTIFIDNFVKLVIAFIEFILGLCGCDLTQKDMTFYAQLMVMIGILLTQTHFVLMMLVLRNESPRYLMEAQKKEEAYAILSLIYKSPDNAKAELDFYQEITEFRQFSNVSWISLCSKENRRAFLICCALMLLRYTTGANAAWNFINVSTNEGLGSLLLVLTLQCIGPLLTGAFFERINLRLALFVGFAFSVVCNIFCFFFGLFENDTYLPFISSAVGGFVTSCTLWPISYLFSLQLLSDKGLSVAVMFNWLSQFVVLIPYSYGSLEKQFHYMVPIYIVMSIFGIIFTWLFIRVTRGTNEKVLKKEYLSPQ